MGLKEGKKFSIFKNFYLNVALQFKKGVILVKYNQNFHP